ncbi:hypothetical protein WA171_004978 [Blastocystis sp. BT1]
MTSGNSTPEESWDKDADLEIQESDSQGKTELTPNFPKCDTVEWNSLKSAGLGDLTTPPIHSVRRELMSHVPSETVVMKYGYVASKVLDALNNIIEHGGVVSSTTLNSIMIQDMELSEDGRDINVRYTILRDNVHSTNRKMASLLDDSDIDSLFVDFKVANSRYIDKPYRFNKRKLSVAELERERQKLQKTHRYQYYPLTLDTVRIIDDLNRSVKGIRFELSRTLQMKRVPQIHFIHLVK